MRGRAGALLAALLLVLVVGGGPAVGSATVTAVGWWTSNPAATAPEGGIAVSAGPSGVVSVAAIRVSLSSPRVTSATLTLREDGGVQAEGASLRVCPTPNAWTAGPRQPLAAAPKAECEQVAAPLRRGSDRVWTADVTAVIAANRTTDPPALMVVPAGSGAVPVGFEVRFHPPQVQAVTESGSGDGDGDTGFSSSPSSSSPSASDFDGPSSPPPAFDDGTGSSFGAGGFSNPSFSPAGDGAFMANDIAPSAADLPLPASEVAPTAPFRRASIDASDGGGSRTGQALFFVALSALVGAGAGFAHRLRWSVLAAKTDR